MKNTSSQKNECAFYGKGIVHPNIARAYEYNLKGIYVKAGSSKLRYRAYCALESCMKGDLFTAIKTNGAFPEPVARYYAH
jgi:hypothetical protein